MAKKKSNSKKGYTKKQLLDKAIGILGKYHAGKFKSVKKQISDRAKTLLNELVEKGYVKNGKAHVTIKNINEILRKHRGKKQPEKAPFVPEEMFTPQSFFNVIDKTDEGNYISWVAQSSKDIEFRSKISPQPYDIFNGGDKIDYETHFKDFADFANGILKLIREDNEIPESEDAVLIATSLPKKDKKTGKWYCEIYTCDVYGEDQDYGFDQTKPKEQPTKIVVPSEDLSKIISTPGKPKAPEPEKPEEKPTQPEKVEPTDKTKIESEERIKKAQIDADKEVRLKEIEAESQRKVKQMKIDALDRLLANDKISIDRYLEELGKL